MAAGAVQSLNSAILAISRPGAFCGNGPSYNDLNATDGTEALQEALYRPWAVKTLDRPYSEILDFLRLWSTGGVLEHDAFGRFLWEFYKTQSLLADFYVAQNHWSRAQADAIANTALKSAVSAHLYFNPYELPTFEPYDLFARAILDHRPMPEVMMLASSLDIREMEQGDGESFLNLAVRYPEAIRFLLNSGANPNRANSFGKTPLMYAAQYNQVETVRLLLAAGADPNAKTTLPADPTDCYHRLTTARMTPLHYAVRYASAPLIRLLLDRGASITTATTVNGETGHYPVDWLRMYTAANAMERNPNLSAADLRTLEPLLRVPNERK